jgi:transcriptional regulator with XRE-family HTH domain
MSQTLAELVRERREAAGMRREDLAARAAISFSAVGLIENGHRAVLRASTLRGLSHALGVSADDLIEAVRQ